MKKGLKNFLKKQQNKASNKADASQDPTANESAEKDKTKSNEPKEVAVDPVVEKAPEKKTTAKQESSDEEEDDLELKTGAYGAIAEEEEKAVTQADDESKNTPAFSMEEEKKPEEAPKQKEKKNASQITFGGKPRFGRGPRAAINDNNDGELADLLEEQPMSKKKAKKETIMLTRQAMNQKPEPAPVEERKGPVKPTFRGKLNLRGAGADTTDSGVKTNYGFEVKYKPEFSEAKEDEKSEAPRAAKKSNKLGQGMSLEEAERQEGQVSTVDEDGFEIVGGGNDRKARRQMGRPRDQEEEEDDGFKIVRNEKRGGAFAAMNN